MASMTTIRISPKRLAAKVLIWQVLAGSVPSLRSKMPCPICAKPTETDYRPFCSKRCADIDLGRWFSESYSVPANDDEADSDTKAAEETPGGRLH